MKPVRSIFTSLLVLGGFVALFSLLHAQETATTVQSSAVSLTASSVEDVSSLSDLEVELKAIELTTPSPAIALTNGGNFYSAQHAPGSAEAWPPLPADMRGVPVWPLGDDCYLLSDLNVNYDAPPTKSLKTAGGMQAMDLSGPPDSGGGGGVTPDFVTPLNLAASTNLWLAITNLANHTAGLLLSNTVADVQYELQGVGSLGDTNWISEGFVFGSELTNWTPASVAATNQPNLFLRVRSWIDDGSGLPDWWQLQYFGYIGVDPNGDPAGDGWSNLQKFQNGWNPNFFYQPAAPQGLTVNFNASTGAASLNWLPAPGPVTGYTIERDGSATVDLSVASGATSFQDNTTLADFEQYLDLTGPNIYGSYRMQAHYAGGDSAWSGVVYVESGTLADVPVAASLVPGPQNSVYLTAGVLPAGTTQLELTYEVIDWTGTVLSLTNLDVPVTAFSNGLYLLPPAWAAPVTDFNSLDDHEWWVQARTATTNASAATQLDNTFTSPETPGVLWLEPPYFDGRAQLKQNLIFQLRAATTDGPFQFTEQSDVSAGADPILYPNNYAYSGFYQLADATVSAYGVFDGFLPFADNYRFRNFAFDAAALDSSGFLTNGVYGGGFAGLNHGLYLDYPPHYLLQAPATTNATLTAMLATNQTRWLNTYPFIMDPASPTSFSPVGFSVAGFPPVWTLASHASNYWGLPFVSAELAYNNGSLTTATLNPGNTFSPVGGSDAYAETAQPAFQTVAYDFWGYSPLPGATNFSTSQASGLLLVPVGSSISVNGYAKLAVQNGYSGVYGYLGQYFDQAYQINTNGSVTTNTTGVLSPYGSFFATQPGPAALVTMPDVDTGQRGTCTVYAVSINLDANHDGNMDLSFNGADATSQSSPMECWVNDGHDQPGVSGNLDKDLEVPPASTNYTARQITCPRNLENFFRLWLCGLPQLPASQGYTGTLSLTPVTGNPAINLYPAYSADGGPEYLTATNVAAAQINTAYVMGTPIVAYGTALGTINANQSYALPVDGYGNVVFTHFLFESAGVGEGQLTLTISQNGNTIAQTSAYLDLHDIKDFYERATITNNTSGAISSWSSTVESVQASATSALGSDTNLIVFVHGFNVGNWDWLDDSDTVFKRLYWAGYQGKFTSVNWPCGKVSLNPYGFNTSEVSAYKASSSLKTYLNQLHARFPNYRLNIFAHSQGNAVVSEAIKQGAPFDTYILTQGAIPASCFDANAPTDPNLVSQEIGSNITPEWQPMGYHGVYTNFTGRIINFYNQVDFALATGTALYGLFPVNWVQNQKLDKPSLYYSYDGANGWYVDFFFIKHLITDPEESRANISRSRTDAVGATVGLVGAINSSIDLQAQFQFGRTEDDHSAQWTRSIQTVLPYYQQILIQIKPTP